MMGLPVLGTESAVCWTARGQVLNYNHDNPLEKRRSCVFGPLSSFFQPGTFKFFVFFNTFETLRSCTLEHVAQVSYRVHLLTCWVVPFLQAKQAWEKKMIRATCNVGKYSILALQCILYFRQISLVSCFHARGSIWMKARPLEKQPGVAVWGVLENNPCGKIAQYL